MPKGKYTCLKTKQQKDEQNIDISLFKHSLRKLSCIYVLLDMGCYINISGLQNIEGFQRKDIQGLISDACLEMEDK